MVATPIDRYMQAMRTSFCRECAQGKHAVIQYEFSGRACGSCHAIIADGTIVVADGTHAHPSAVVRADFDLWMRVLRYEIEPLLALEDGLYAASGDLDILIESDTWFRR